jgi:uncharacterized membrane protein YbhN (UPF0104 family)
MNLPANFTRRVFIVCGVAAAAWIGAALAFGWDDMSTALGRFGAGTLAQIGGLSLLNYGLRWLRWQVFLQTIARPLPLRPSVAVYFATYVMVITPGKLGEVFKAAIMRDRWGIPLALGLPVVLAERVFDFLAVAALAAGGLAVWQGPGHGIEVAAAAAVGFAVLLWLLNLPATRRTIVARAAASRHLQGHAVALDEAQGATGRLLAPGPGTGHLLLTIVAWLAECAGLWLACRVLVPGIGPADAVFIYAASTLAGSISFLPGGLGGTEAVMVLLL